MGPVWENASAAIEVAQGKAIADAAIAAGATQLIWSSLPSIERMTAGRISGAKHFESKAEVEAYIRTLDIKSMFFMTAWFMQNQLGFMRPRGVSMIDFCSRACFSSGDGSDVKSSKPRRITARTYFPNRGNAILGCP